MKIKQFIKSFFILVGLYFLTLLIQSMFLLFIKNEAISLSVSYFLVCILLIIIFKKDLKYIKVKKNFLKYLIVFIICFLLTTLFSNLIIRYINIQSSTEVINKAFILKHHILSFFIMVILGPFFEEVVFRLNFKDVFNSKWVFIIITGFLFGLSHLIGITNIKELLYIVPYSIMGISLSYIYKDSNNIYISTLFHSLNNLIILIQLLIGR